MSPGHPQAISLGRPRATAANIRTWIGFKEFMRLLEEAVLQCSRRLGFGPSRLYHELGRSVALVDASVQLPSLLDLDDEVSALVDVTAPGRFSVHLIAGDDARLVLRGRATVGLTEELVGPLPPLPSELSAVFAPIASEAPAIDFEPHCAPLWSWPVRYFHCGYSSGARHAAYVTALEEAVDRFLAARGVPIGRVLREDGLIPVVSRVRLRKLSDCAMDEVVHTSFVVEDLLKDAAFEGRMDCWVRRGDDTIHVATARVLHGYAIAHGERAGRLARLEGDLRRALRPGGAT